jgi:multimeric flavodoxin WrbA
MKAIAINGSPRKKGNTATLPEHALAGAASQSAEAEKFQICPFTSKSISIPPIAPRTIL